MLVFITFFVHYNIHLYLRVGVGRGSIEMELMKKRYRSSDRCRMRKGDWENIIKI